MTVSLAIVIVIHSVEVSAMYPHVVISSPAKRLENLLFLLFTLHLVYGLEIITCRYNGLLQVAHPTLLGYSQYRSVAKVSRPNGPLAPCRTGKLVMVPLRSTKSDTLLKPSLISEQVVPYQIYGGTCCPGGSTPKKWSLADLSNTNHKL
jgi:hypothetical protein